MEKIGKRFTARVSKSVHDKIETAAVLVGTTVSKFALEAALEKADAVIQNESAMTLTSEYSNRVLELLESPESSNYEFVNAMPGVQYFQ
ncbi:MAG TPA: DUF1778 domain-containing protein [Methylophilus sp.]